MTDVRARTTTGARNGLRYLIYGFGLLLALLGASCGSNIFSVGTALVTIHSKPGRFTSYVVILTDIQLTRQDGNVIELPFLNQRVDLANIGPSLNLMGAPPVEIGTYVSASLVFDYTSVPPVITVDQGGTALTADKLLDEATGVAPTTQTIAVKFDPSHPFVVNDQKTQELNFNIDLEASNIVGAPDANNGVTVTVKPIWNVTAQPNYDRPVYARGLYVTTDKNNNKIIMNVRPLKDIIDNPFGAISVNVNDQTYYNVNGVAYTGAAGLSAVASLQNVYAYLPIAVYGPPTGNPFSNEQQGVEASFAATQVYVGTSLESTIEDQVTGFISAVNGTTLTMQNAALFDHVGNLGFAKSLPITVGTNTIVSIDGNGSVTPSLSSVSVGQVVTVLGIATEPNNASADYTPTAFDATATQLSGAQIRLQNSQLFGTLNSGTANSASLNLVALGGVEPTNVQFAGTGTSGGADATTANYVVATPTDQSATAAGTLLMVDGMTNTFGQGPPYFNATALTSTIQAQLVIEWTATGGNKGGSLSPFTSADGNSIVVNLADANLKASDGSLGNAYVQTGPVPIQNSSYYSNLLGSNPPPNPTQLTIVYNTQDPQHPPLFAVGNLTAGALLESTPSSFIADFQTISKSNTVAIRKLTAYGQYDPTTGTFSATNITINAYQ